METDKQREFKDYIRSTLPEWASLEDDDIEFQRLSSLSNLVFLVKSTKEVSPNPLIFRKFATKEGVVDREKESKIFVEMSKRGVGPKCYGGNNQYRLEEYFDARPIENKEYNEPEFRRKLAIAIANLHKINVKGIESDPLFAKHLHDDEYFKIFEAKCNEKIYTTEEQAMIDELKYAIHEDEIGFLKDILPNDDIVFSHNDLLSGNVLIRKDNRNIILIDYEYGAFNFRGFDIGNMYKESMINYTHPETPFFKFEEDLYPSKDDLKEFIQYYLAFSDMDESEQKQNYDKFVEDYAAFQEYLNRTYDEKFDARIAKIERETKIGVMLSHYYWLVWAVKMCKTPDSDFDYITFAHTKFSYYKKLKEEISSLDSLTKV